MKSVLMRGVPWLLVACAVDTPVVEGDRLGKDLGAWCQSMCDRLDACIDDQRVTCLGTCVEYFSAFSGKGSDCRDAGLRAMDCIDGATCEELDSANACFIAEEQESCLDTGETTCRGSFSSADPTCDFGFNACTDGNEYSLECLSEGDSPECTCKVNGLATGRFAPSRLLCPSGSEAAQTCAWPIVIYGNELPPTLCDVTGAELPVADPAECAAQYTDCSDGRDYEVRCVGSEENVVCDCNVDGQTVGSFESSTGICPFLDDVDGGRAEANYGCGFKIAPVEFR